MLLTQTTIKETTKMTRKTSKTPLDIVREMEAKLAKARARADRVEADSNPILSPMLDLQTALDKEIAGYSRLFTGNQSYANRKLAFELRLQEIELSEELAEITFALLKNKRRDLKVELDILLDNKTASVESVQRAIDSLQVMKTPKHIQLEGDVRDAIRERKAFTEQRAVKPSNLSDELFDALSPDNS